MEAKRHRFRACLHIHSVSQRLPCSYLYRPRQLGVRGQRDLDPLEAQKSSAIEASPVSLAASARYSLILVTST
jgi:hypothetical protein